MKNLSLSNYQKSQTSDIRIFKSPTNETIHVVNGKLETANYEQSQRQQINKLKLMDPNHPLDEQISQELQSTIMKKNGSINEQGNFYSQQRDNTNHDNLSKEGFVKNQINLQEQQRDFQLLNETSQPTYFCNNLDNQLSGISNIMAQSKNSQEINVNEQKQIDQFKEKQFENCLMNNAQNSRLQGQNSKNNQQDETKEFDHSLNNINQICQEQLNLNSIIKSSILNQNSCKDNEPKMRDLYELNLKRKSKQKYQRMKKALVYLNWEIIKMQIKMVQTKGQSEIKSI